MGSYYSEKWDLPSARKIVLAAISVAIIVIVQVPIFRWLVYSIRLDAFAIRLLLSVCMVAIPGFLMGIPFPAGLAAVRKRAPVFVPWAWAVNATASVIATPLSLMISLTMGLSWILYLASICYVCAAAAYGSSELLHSKSYQAQSSTPS